MASHFYATTVPGVTGGIDGVVTATATQGTNIELRVDDGTVGNSKVEILKAIEALVNFIVTDNAPA
jgi:hypothetical protein